MFWCTDDNKKATDYEDRVHTIGAFSTVEEFWSIYSHMKRVSTLPTSFDYHLFQEGIKPMWEDSNNKAGGKWLIRLKKGILNVVWERLIIGLIGGAFVNEALPLSEVTGCVASVRSGEDVISIWNRDRNNAAAKDSIRAKLIEILMIPKDTILEYREHDASLAHSHGKIDQTSA